MPWATRWRLSRQAHARFDHAAGRAGQGAHHGDGWQIRCRLHPGLHARIIVSFSYDENVAVAGKSGISYASSVNRRGDHGSFSPTDVRISLMISGPDFKSGFNDTLPTANVDIAPTVARILDL